MCVICNLPESSSYDKLRSAQAGLPVNIKYGEMLELSELPKVVVNKGRLFLLKFTRDIKKKCIQR